MTLFSVSIAWLLAVTAGIREYAESDPFSEAAGLKSALQQLGKWKKFSNETIFVAYISRFALVCVILVTVITTLGSFMIKWVHSRTKSCCISSEERETYSISFVKTAVLIHAQALSSDRVDNQET